MKLFAAIGILTSLVFVTFVAVATYAYLQPITTITH